MKNWKDNVYFILVEPKEPGNIGASARAIKNMGFKNLCLVRPPANSEGAVPLAHNAMDVLETTEVYNSVEEAIKGRELVTGTSRRRGRTRGVFTSVEEGASRLYQAASLNKVAVLFGREDRGLYNEEVDECGFLMTIPSSNKQPSLNLSHAVQIVAYELSRAEFRCPDDSVVPDGSIEAVAAPKFTGRKEMDLLCRRLEDAFKMIEYIPADNAYLNKKIMQNIRHFLGRSGLTKWEYSMFHSICKHIEKKLG